ncbi:MAG: hypothetical protein HW380_3428 [Magnetococcales bacterium]|nr:hypothetical protein [Magnetococcales bacterium]HIJ85463.1 hypothetical protein [Magnetococcales bacterium]
MKKNQQPPFRVPVFFLLSVGIPAFAAFLYFQGLWGGYLFDDHTTLEGLTFVPLPFSLEHWLYYLGSGTSSPLGRPLALLTFLLQRAAWPEAPMAFKGVNLAIHLGNGLLLWALIVKIGPLVSGRQRLISWVAATASLLWLIHPIQVSAVLHIVQRMTLLAATFIFAGMWLYLHGREKWLENHHSDGYPRVPLLWCTMGVAGCGLLSVLAKENGALLPLLLLVLESTLLAGSSPVPVTFRRFRVVLLTGPLLLLTVYFIWHAREWLDGYGDRPFTMGERLLSQFRVVMVYLRQIFLPDWQAFGLDPFEFSISRGWLQPVSTLLAAMVLVLSVVLAIRFAKRFPIAAFSLLWFFAAHLLESTFLPLELYFEHRNYVPMAGLVIAPATLLVWGVENTSDSLWRWPVGLIAGGVVTFLALLTYEETRLWGQPVIQSQLMAARNPTSMRSQESLAHALILAGRGDEALVVLDRMAKGRPRDFNPGIVKMAMVCNLGSISGGFSSAFFRLAATQPHSNPMLTIGALRELAKKKEKGLCPTVTLQELLKLTEACLANPHRLSQTSRANLQSLAGRFHALMGEKGKAIAAMDAANAVQPYVSQYVYLAIWLMDVGRFEESQARINAARILSRTHPLTRVLDGQRIERIQRLLHARMNGRPTPGD